MLQNNTLQAVYPSALTALLKMVNDQSVASSLSSRDAAIDADEIFLQDWEDQSLGGGGSFAILKSSTTPLTRVDMASFLGDKDVRQYLGQGLKDLHQRQGQKVRLSNDQAELTLIFATILAQMSSILSQIPAEVMAPFQQYMA
jgi:hypothetical protein